MYWNRSFQVILDEFGVDKTSDVLDSAEANHLFDDLFMESISNPETMDQELAKALKVIQGGARDKRFSRRFVFRWKVAKSN